MKAGYLKDALKYLTIAHENDPVDFSTMLKLGWVYNILHDDRDAVKWFNLASKSSDSSISGEASKAYHNLAPEFQRLRTTVWIFPFFSSRWHDVFGYGQIKTELKLGRFPIRPYLSVRFVGDTRGTIGPTSGNADPQYLSETSFIFGVGMATLPWRGMTGWFEAGEAVKYLPSRTDVGAMIPDYRGGVSYAKGFGHLMNSSKGLFFETNDDAVFVSRFQDDMLYYSQNRAGYTFASLEGFGGLQAQLYWNGNATADRLHQYWANYAETGPGLRFRFRDLPKSLLFSVNFLRGAYTINLDNPRRPNYFDLRVGIWYAFYAKLTLAVLGWAASLHAATLNYHIAGDDPGPWPEIFASIGITRASGGPANLFVVRNVAAGSVPQWMQRIEQGGIVILEGEGELAAALGISPSNQRVVVRSIVDQHAPKLPIVWESPLEIPIFNVPKGSTVIATERWDHAPVTVALHRGTGAVLWIAAAPGKEGYERFPYLLQALNDLGIEAALPQPAPVGILRWLLPLACRPRLLRRPLAQSGHRRAPRRRLALLRAERRIRRIPAPAD